MARNDTASIASNNRKQPKLQRFSKQCFCTVFFIVFIFVGIIALMVVIPVVQRIRQNMGSSNGKNGPVAPKEDLVLIDPDTPKNQRTIVSYDRQETWKLVYSDEFNKEGRKFLPGDDAAWEAMDFWYEATQDEEYYDPNYVTTRGGNLVIKADNVPKEDLKYTSGMLQSWNKVCFTGGRVEMRVSLPGKPRVSGFWPGAWLLGNLARAGYKSTTDGVWPYSYDSCDGGVAANQSLTTGLSHQTGQKLNKCVCPGEEHPNPGTGRGAPEIDLIEALASHSGGEVSQTYQIAPFDLDRKVKPDQYKIFESKTTLNPYVGTPLQQSVSALTKLPDEIYGGDTFATFAVEYQPGEDGYITWLIDEKPVWTINADAIGPNEASEVSRRLIPEEPMYMILNLALSSKFSPISPDLEFPAEFLIDHVRIYQHPKRVSITCDPESHPTSDYIVNHPRAYYNKNWTNWELAGYKKPKYKINSKCK